MEEGFADGIYGAESGAAASAIRPTMMSMKAHGVQEITARIPEEPAAPEGIPDGLDDLAAEAAKRQEIIKRAEIARRAAIAASL